MCVALLNGWVGAAPNESDVMFCAVELGGETGEALNVIKKMERSRLGIKGGKFDMEALCDELADVIICVDRVAACYDVDLGAVVKNKFNATSEKYGLKNKIE